MILHNVFGTLGTSSGKAVKNELGAGFIKNQDYYCWG